MLSTRKLDRHKGDVRPAKGAAKPMDSISSDARRFEDEFAMLLEGRDKIPAKDSIDRYWFVHVPADRPPWTDTGIEVVAGDRLSVFCAGRAWIKKHPQAWVEAYFALWLRIGALTEMFRTPKGSLTFAAEHSGRLYLSNVFPGQWVDAYGRIANAAVLEESAAGGFTVLVIRWRADAAHGLRELAERRGPAALFAQEELQRLRNPVVVPEGWRYLPSLGDAGVFSRVETPESAVIHCQCDNDAMILQRSLEAPFTPDTRVRWSWKVESLPSARAEDSLPELGGRIRQRPRPYLFMERRARTRTQLSMPRRFVAPPRDPYSDPLGARGARPMDRRRARPLARLSKCDRFSSRSNSRRLANCRQYFSARPRALRVSGHRIGRSVEG
jgi:hypothetical protein